jgi:hypothetical protein
MTKGHLLMPSTVEFPFSEDNALPTRTLIPSGDRSDNMSYFIILPQNCFLLVGNNCLLFLILYGKFGTIIFKKAENLHQEFAPAIVPTLRLNDNKPVIIFPC